MPYTHRVGGHLKLLQESTNADQKQLEIILKGHKSQVKTRAVRGSDYSPTIALSDEKDKLV